MTQLWGEFIPADEFDDGSFVPVEPGFGDSGFEAMANGVNGMIAIVFVLVIAGIVWGGVVAYRKHRVLKDAGIDPFTVDAAIAAKVLNSNALAPQPTSAAQQSLEQRLLELDDLHARGVITDDEHREARAAALRA